MGVKERSQRHLCPPGTQLREFRCCNIWEFYPFTSLNRTNGVLIVTSLGFQILFEGLMKGQDQLAKKKSHHLDHMRLTEALGSVCRLQVEWFCPLLWSPASWPGLEIHGWK